MLPQHLYQHILEILSLKLGQNVASFLAQPVSGGSINQTYRIQIPDGPFFFCKINRFDTFPHLFLKEQRGLQLIGQTGTVAVPKSIAYTVTENYQVLLLQWIESGPKGESFFKHFGMQLAALHQHTQAQFGLQEDNYMGSLPQQNTPCKDWCTFFIEQRLQPLIDRCIQNELLTHADVLSFEKLYQKLPQIFSENQPPALLHGDLWSGNYLCNSSGQPVLIDPAVYYGHPAVDLGMTRQFGGFENAFYESYNYHHLQPDNSAEQQQVCNLYPLLVHLLLFGSSYLGSIQQTLKAFA